MSEFVQRRHQPPWALESPRPLRVACPGFRSKVNFSRIVRLASCCGVAELITSGSGKVDPVIARDGSTEIKIRVHRSLDPQLQSHRRQGFQLVGLEQTSGSENLHEFSFERNTILVLGHERHGIADSTLQILDRVVEIPIYGLPYSYNVVTAAAMALYEYCRQFPQG